MPKTGTERTVSFWSACFWNNWTRRADTDPKWRGIHRRAAQNAIRELRYWTNRPSKRTHYPFHYGQQVAGLDGPCRPFIGN